MIPAQPLFLISQRSSSEVIEKTADKYREAYKRITGKELE